MLHHLLPLATVSLLLLFPLAHLIVKVIVARTAVAPPSTGQTGSGTTRAVTSGAVGEQLVLGVLLLRVRAVLPDLLGHNRPAHGVLVGARALRRCEQRDVRSASGTRPVAEGLPHAGRVCRAALVLLADAVPVPVVAPVPRVGDAALATGAVAGGATPRHQAVLAQQVGRGACVIVDVVWCVVVVPGTLVPLGAEVVALVFVVIVLVVVSVVASASLIVCDVGVGLGAVVVRVVLLAGAAATHGLARGGFVLDQLTVLVVDPERVIEVHEAFVPLCHGSKVSLFQQN